MMSQPLPDVTVSGRAHSGKLDVIKYPGPITSYPNYANTGQPCLKCRDKCPGLELHYFRKICSNCRCLVEDHDIPSCTQRDNRPLSMLFQPAYEDVPLCDIIGSSSSPSPQLAPPSASPSPSPQQQLPPPSPPSPPSPPERHVPEWASQFGKLSVSDRTTTDLTHLKAPQNDLVLTKLISENVRSQKFISMLPEDKQEFAANLRRKQLQRQMPLHDLDPRFCNSLAADEAAKFEKFAARRRKKAAGIGQIGEVANEGSLVGCAGCHQKMEKGSPAVIATRVPGSCWHPGCFTCSTCQQLLVDMIYFAKKGRIYCERHYADSLYPRCAACDEIIFSREYTQAEDQSWHVHHFCCWYCDTPLAGQRYIAKDNNPYCVICFDKLFSKMCGTCQRPITGDTPGVSHGDSHWHACTHCFSCQSCGRALLNSAFLLSGGRLFCTPSCQRQVGTHCGPAAFPTHYSR